MQATHQEPSDLVLAIAGINVQLDCPDLALQAGLRKRYRDCLGSAPVDMCLEIHLENRSGPPELLSLPPIFKDGQIHYDASAYQGVIDPQRGLGWLRFSCQQPEAEVEYFLRVVYALLAFQRGGLLFHGAGIVHRARVYVFFGHSGSGKTTVSRLSAGDMVLNDDLVILLPVGSGWSVHATPFWNPDQAHPTMNSGSLAAMFSLVQDRRVYLEGVSASLALAELVSSVPVLPADPLLGANLMLRCHELLAKVPLFRLHFMKDGSFWQAIDPGAG